MTSDTKRKVLACLGAVAVLTIVIAMGLPRLELRPGVPLPALAGGDAGAQPGQSSSQVPVSISTLWKAVFGIGFLTILGLIGYKALRNATWSWKEVLKSLLYVYVPIMVVVVVLSLIPSVPITSAPPAQEALPSVMEQPGPPLGPPSLDLIWLVVLGLAILLTGAGAWFVFRPARHRGEDQLALQAELALQALKNGAELKNVIVRCYWQMEQVLKEEQGIEMKSVMTVREFESLLEARNVPTLPVHQLTSLFEMVRYGHRTASGEDERQAINALTAISQYSRAARPQGPA